MKKLSEEEIIYLQKCLEFGFRANDLNDQLSSDDLNIIIRDYELTYFMVAGIEYFFERLDSFQEAAVLFESVRFFVENKRNLYESTIIDIAASAALMSLSNKTICRYAGVFHDQMTIETEIIDINSFKENNPSDYQRMKKSFRSLNASNDIWKQIYGYSIFLENKFEEIRNIQTNGMKMDIKKKEKIDDKYKKDKL